MSQDSNASRYLNGKFNLRIIATIVVIIFTSLLTIWGLSLGLDQPCPDPEGSVDFRFDEQNNDSTTLEILHDGGMSLEANRTYIEIGDTSASWAELASDTAHTELTAGAHVTVQLGNQTRVRAYYVAPPDAQCMSGNQTLGTYHVSTESTR